MTANPSKMASGNFALTGGPGYRVYYAQAGKTLVLLLTGGDKRKQQADIAAAVDYWNDWKRKNTK